MNKRADLKNNLILLDLYNKGKEIYYELGDQAVISYIRSSHHLLSKVYHPDLNPNNTSRTIVIQQRLNNVSELIKNMTDEEIVQIFKSTPQEPKIKKTKILVVEDEFGLQEMYREILIMEGYDARAAVDGVNGYKMYIEFKPDLVFTDVVMPEMNGLELVKRIRETDPGIKVIYISGFFGIKRLKQQLDEDIRKYGYPTLAKPFKASEMLELVSNYLAE
jgi:CheY-like chemotaxis protein